MLDRLACPNPPKLVCIDTRFTPVAAKATIFLQPKNGTNMAVMNGIQRELVKNGWYDQEYIDRVSVTHTLLSCPCTSAKRTKILTPSSSVRLPIRPPQRSHRALHP